MYFDENIRPVGYDKWKNYTDLGGNRPTNVVLATANMLFYDFWCFLLLGKNTLSPIPMI